MSDGPQTPAPEGLSDSAASGLCYLFIPAIIFLATAPYNQKAEVRFHAWQSIIFDHSMGCRMDCTDDNVCHPGICSSPESTTLPDSLDNLAYRSDSLDPLHG